MILPTIHTNGTGAEMLMEGYIEARTAIEAAKDALAKIEFNARDYYPQGEAVWATARAEMSERHRMLNVMSDDLMAIAIHIDGFRK